MRDILDRNLMLFKPKLATAPCEHAECLKPVASTSQIYLKSGINHDLHTKKPTNHALVGL